MQNNIISHNNRKDNMTKETININGSIKYKGKLINIPSPFNQCYFGNEPTKEITIGNRFNDENYQQYAKLPAFAVAIYDTIIGAEQTEDYDTMQKGLDWFSRNFKDAYFKLLD